MSDIGAVSYEDIKQVTPSDTLPNIFAGFTVSTTGVVTITTWAGTKVVAFPVIAGVQYTIPVRLIWNTGSTAVGTIFGLVHARYNQ
jgi:hypothetical protein